MRTTSRWLAAAVLAAGVGAAAAQDAPKDDAPKVERRKGRPGFGGQFPGMAAGLGGPAQMVTHPAVLDDIQATAEQKEKLTAWAKDSGRKFGQQVRDKLKDVPQNERREKMAELMAEASGEAYAELADVLKPEQVTRVKQIAVQVAGVRAFAQPDVRKQLALTVDQADRIKGIADDAERDAREVMREAFTPGQPPDREAVQGAMKKVTAANKEALEKAAGVLSADQKKTWDRLTGEPFDVTKLATGRPGLGGGRPGRRPAE